MNIKVSSLIIILLPIIFFYCSKDKSINIIKNSYSYYINAWPDSLISTGVGTPNSNLPLSAQRAGAIRAAKIDLYQNLIDSVKSL